MSILLFYVLLVTTVSWAAPPLVPEKLLETINSNGQNEQQQQQQNVHLQRLVNSVEKDVVHNADEHHKMPSSSSTTPTTSDDVHLTVVKLTKQEGLENLMPLLPAFQVHDVHLIMPETKNNTFEIKEKLILNTNTDDDNDNDDDEPTTMATTITTLMNNNYNESMWETTTMDADIEMTTATSIKKLSDEIENHSKLLTSTTSTTTTTTTTTAKTPLNDLKETEKELKEKIAEIEAEPLILSARV